MPPLVRQFSKALASDQPTVPWWEATVAYLVLICSVLFWIYGSWLYVFYWECTGERGRLVCNNADYLQPTSGSYDAIVWTVAVLSAISVAAAAVVQLTVRKLHFTLVWSLALLSLAASGLAFFVISGWVGTPWGTLVTYESL